MTKKANLALFGWTVLMILLIKSQIWASCPGIYQHPPCHEFWQADAVFIAAAVSVERKPTNPDSYYGAAPRIVKLKVEESFRGVDEKELVLDLNDCGYDFKQGEKYLVYARRRGDNGKLDIRLRSSRTQPLAKAAEDLQYIRSVLRGDKQPSLIGTVGQTTADVRTDSRKKFGLGDNILGSIFYGEPAAGVKVFAEGKEQTYETASDGAGFYSFFDLPVGNYKIRADFPSYFSLKETDVTIKPEYKGCALGYLGANRKGLIGGRISDVNGSPLKGVYVSLVSADAAQDEITAESNDYFPWAVSVTLENGEYGFASLPAGKYLIVINRGERERSYGDEAAQKLPRLFYPGATELEKAAVVSLKEGEQLKGKDFRVAKISQ